MKTELAAQLLSNLVDLGDDLDTSLPRLQANATWKWDSYEGFRAGQRFLESLARWLQEFENGAARRRWLDFVLDDLVFISAHELDHVIATAYETALRPAFIRRAAARIAVQPYLTAQITASPIFKEEQRRTLIIGLSDGARLDQLRRSNSELSHEQYAPSIDLDGQKGVELLTKLDKALTTFGSSAERRFAHVVLVDDFYGSGTSLIDLDDNHTLSEPRLKGKVGKFYHSCVTPVYDQQTVDNPQAPKNSRLLTVDFDVTILLYVASDQAVTHIESTLERAGLNWKLQVIQPIPESKRVTDAKLIGDCRNFWDPALEDEHKGNSSLGYRDCALPLVLHHNAPNNSVCPLWADSNGRGEKNRHALFPRYERHHKDRP